MVVEFAGVHLQIVEFAVVATVVDDEFVAQIAIHRGECAIASLQCVVVFTAHEVPMVIRRCLPRMIARGIN